MSTSIWNLAQVDWSDGIEELRLTAFPSIEAITPALRDAVGAELDWLDEDEVPQTLRDVDFDDLVELAEKIGHAGGPRIEAIETTLYETALDYLNQQS